MLRLILFCLCAFKMAFANWWKHANFAAKLFSLFRKHQRRFKHKHSVLCNRLIHQEHNVFYFFCVVVFGIRFPQNCQPSYEKPNHLSWLPSKQNIQHKKKKEEKNNRKWFTPTAHYIQRFVHKHSISLTYKCETGLKQRPQLLPPQIKNR